MRRRNNAIGVAKMGNGTNCEETLETMTEEQLRAECLRLSQQLRIATVKLLTQPVLDTRPIEVIDAELDLMIAKSRAKFREMCQKDMSEPTTAEIDLVRELVKLVKQRNYIKEAHDSQNETHQPGNQD